MCPPAVLFAGVTSPDAAHLVSVLRSMPRARAAAPVLTKTGAPVVFSTTTSSHLPHGVRRIYPESTTCTDRTVLRMVIAANATFPTIDDEESHV